MSTFLTRLRRAAKATVEAHDVAYFRVRGVDVVCPICSEREFVQVRDREVRRPLFGGLNLPWLRLDRASTTLICTHCAHLLSFGRAPERLDRSEATRPQLDGE